MRCGCLFLLSFFLPLWAWAGRPAFKAFRVSKVHLNKAVYAAGDELTIMMDQACVADSVRAKKSFTNPFLLAKHKASGRLQFEAITVQLTMNLSREDILASANENPCVIGVTENARVYTQGDPLQAQQMHLPAISFDRAEKFFFHPLFGIRAPVTIAVVDSGVQMDHPDLAPRMWTGSSSERGVDFVNNDADPSDDFGHGTHVSGLICAQKDNGLGIRGIMGEWSKLMAVKTQDASGMSDMARVINGILWAVDHGAEVINLSLSSKSENALLQDALEYALDHAVTVVAASGNDGEEITAANFVSPVGYAKDLSGVIGVGAIDYTTFNRANYSNYSASYVEIAAPASHGVDGLMSTYPGSTYKLEAGTSMAAPQVAGAAALIKGFMKSRSTNVTPAQIEDYIEASAIQNSQNFPFFVHGRSLNLENLSILIFNSTVIDSGGGFDE